LNCLPDISRKKIPAELKGIVSGETRTARNPGSAAFDLILRAGHLYGLNPPMPEIEDTSDAFERRWVLIACGRKFSGDPTRDPQVVEKILATYPQLLSQLVRWFLEGAVRLIRQRTHTFPTSHYLILDRWMRRANPVGRFVERALVRGGAWTRVSELHAAFLGWLTSLRDTDSAVSIEAFGRRLRELDIPASERSDGTYYALALSQGNG